MLPNEKICQLRTAFILKRNRIERCVIRAFSLSKFLFQALKWLDSLCKSAHRQNAPAFHKRKILIKRHAGAKEAFRIIRVYAFKGGDVKPFARPERRGIQGRKIKRPVLDPQSRKALRMGAV